jgi:undecaprenyl-diphosphatase
MDILIAVVLGIIEGVTEFLPISSTGHLIVAEELFGFKDVNDLFTVVVQLGAILAVVGFYWRDLLGRTIGLLRWQKEAVRFWQLLVLATLPAGVVGLLLNNSMDKITTPLVVAIMLIVGGIILWVVDRKPVDHTEQVADIGAMPFKRALIVGLGQSLAIVPGVSRSGATIVTGLAAGLNRPTATAFSFYLSIPVMILASGLKLFKDAGQLGQLAGGTAALIAGVIAAFLTALISITWLLRYISRHNFKPFAYYRIAAGLVILLLLAMNVL